VTQPRLLAREARPLAGVRVLDGTARLAGAYAGKMLRDVGADVVVAGAVDDIAVSRWLHGGKRSVEPDAARELRALADIVLVDDPAAANDAPQGTVTVSITDFGSTGPWADRPASHLTLEAESGSLGSRGIPELPPVAVGGELGEWIAGLYAAVAALAAWRTARESGVAEHVEVSVLECMLVTLNMHEPLHAAFSGSDAFTRWVQVPSVERTKDGWVCFSLVTGQQWLDFTAMIERPDLGEDASLNNMLGRWPRRHEIYAAMDPWLTARTVDEVVETATAFRLPVAHVTDGSMLATMEHFRVREVFRPSPHGDYVQPRPPYRFSGCATAPAAPAPIDMTDAGEIADQWRATSRPIGHEAPRRPLEGVRIVDLTAFFAGPSGTGYLAALGADVIKVESIQRPDGIRFAGGQITQAGDWWEYSWVFHGVNADKRGVTLDLTRDEGIELLYRLLEGADVLIENYSPRVMEQFGLAYERLAASYPSLVVTRMPAFGLDGPWAQRVGFALTMEALAGMATTTGHPNGKPTCPGGVLDPIAGLHAAFATLVALEQRGTTGTGQLVEVPMIECALNIAPQSLLEWGANGTLLARQGNRSADAIVQDVYECAGEDAWIAVTVRTEEQQEALAQLLTADGLDTADLDGALRAHLVGRVDEDAADELLRAGIPAGVIRRPTVAGQSEHVQARVFYETHEHPTIGPVGYPVLPTRFASWTGTVHSRPAPTLGQHNSEVLGRELGIGADKLAELERDAVIGTRPAGL
jgi:crotonobetainyl-CoA:carnitine CoA-transferase CaiB-like acyl-CoA transferase